MKINQTNVIACVDGSNLTKAVCDYAAWMANQLHSPLTLLHSINHHQETSKTSDLSGNIGLGSQEHLMQQITELEQQQSKLKLQQGKLILQAAKERILEKNNINEINCSHRHGDLIESLIELEDSIGVLVLGLRGQVHHDQPHQIGAKLEAIIRSLHRPILIVNDSFKQPNKIMIAYDGSTAAQKAVDMVAESPAFNTLECHLVCVNKNENTACKLLDQAHQKLNSNQSLKVIKTILAGKTDEELCAFQTAQDIDLTIMGAFSHTRIHDMLLGSFTHKMLLNTNKTLLLLR